jgi:putative transposase
MIHDEIKNLAQAAAKNIKTEADLNEFRQMLTKITVETALNAELDDHLGYSKHEASDASNSRDGTTRKTLKQMMVSSSLRRQGIEKALSSPSWS